MKLRLKEKNLAIKYRLQGYSYNEIISKIPNLSKGTLSGWLKGIELKPDDKRRIRQKIRNAAALARIKGAWTNKQKAIERIGSIQKLARKEFADLSQDRLFIVGLCLYWAEGSKTQRNFQFINSDPTMIKVILKWLREILHVNEETIGIRLYIHKVYEDEDCESFWARITNIPREKFLKTVYKPTPHIIKKNKKYKGCCRIELRGSEVFWKVQKWQEMLVGII